MCSFVDVLYMNVLLTKAMKSMTLKKAKATTKAGSGAGVVASRSKSILDMCDSWTSVLKGGPGNVSV